MNTATARRTEAITDGRRMCRAYYGVQVQAEGVECDAIYYSERDYWDHLARAARIALMPGEEEKQS